MFITGINVLFRVIICSAAYLKEPQATPLIPATASGNQNSNFIAIIVQNPVMFAIGIVMLCLVVILLIGLLLMTRAKRKRSAEVKRYFIIVLLKCMS